MTSEKMEFAVAKRCEARAALKRVRDIQSLEFKEYCTMYISAVGNVIRVSVGASRSTPGRQQFMTWFLFLLTSIWTYCQLYRQMGGEQIPGILKNQSARDTNTDLSAEIDDMFKM